MHRLSLRLGSDWGCRGGLNKEELLRRTAISKGSVLEERKRGSRMVYRWWEKEIRRKAVRRKLQIGVERTNESVAQRQRMLFG